MKRKFLYLVLAGCIVTSFASQLKADDVPMLISYQGRLTDSTGSPRNGTFSMTFAFYDAASAGNTLPAGSPWVETQNVQVTNGIFSVLLGSVTAIPGNLFTGGPSDSAGPLRFLQVTVAGEALSPRTRIVSAPYAIRAEVARFADTPTVQGSPGPQGPQGPQGSLGSQGPPGPTVGSVSICFNSSSGGCTAFGSEITCGSSPCTAVSSSGSCSAQVNGFKCCVCRASNNTSAPQSVSKVHPEGSVKTLPKKIRRKK